MPHFKARDGARLHYLDVGRGAPVVMLHAFGMRGAHWLPFVLPFVHRRRFLLLDFRGFGGSRGVAYSERDALAQNADDVHDLISHLALERPRLAGFSIGAATGLAYLRRHGFAHIAAYLHIDQTPCIANKPNWRWGLMGADNARAIEGARTLVRAFEGVDRTCSFAALDSGQQRAFRDWFDAFFGDTLGEPWKTMFRLAGRWAPGRRLLNLDDWSVYLDCVRSVADEDYDFREALRRAHVPVWVLIGGRSGVFPADGQRRIADYAPDTRLIEFPRCGHAVPVEAPASFLLALRRFLYAPVGDPA